MVSTKKCLNLDDTGLGTTILTLGFIYRIKEKTIVVVKPENLMQWMEETVKFTDMKFTYIRGNKTVREKHYCTCINLK